MGKSRFSTRALMRGLVLAALAPALWFARPPAAESAPPIFPPRIRWQLEAALRQGMAQTRVPGAVVGLWVPGVGEFVRTAGQATFSPRRSMRRVDHLRIGSITKTMTVTALLQLAEEGALGLDDPVSDYLPFVPNGENITLRMLAAMESGIASYTHNPDWVAELHADPRRVWTPEELVQYGFDLPTEFDPGEGWDYSNTNTILLGLVIEQVASQKTPRNLAQVLRERIFAPLGMRNTFLASTPAMPFPFAHGITNETADGRVADATFYSPSWAWAAGGVVSTLDNLRIYTRALGTGRGLLSPAMQQERFQWSTFPPNGPNHKYGLGIGYDHGWLGHEGQLPGYNATIFYFPPRDAVLVVLVNSDIEINEQSPVQPFARAFTRILTPGNVVYTGDLQETEQDPDEVF